YVLVPGAYHAAWSWRLVGEELERRGVAWVAVDLPSATTGAHPETYLRDDAAEVVASAAGLGPVVLVGHSYGGAVITEAAPDLADLVGLVYVAALLPEPGESAYECVRRVPARTLLDEATRHEDGVLSLDPARARDALYADCDEAIAEWALANLSTQTLASFRSPRTAPPTTVPSTYVVCTLDAAIDPLLQELLAARCDEVVVLESGHCPMLSRVGTLVEAILAAPTGGPSS
ncbi:MAG TPA: alpha/beta hydrolase, partial [Acidimicrobiales bacterium]|nr:alpha/beta hydrolase [Acidimicrobiales bacterium]